MSTREWWTVKELASHYRIGIRTIYGEIASGKLTVHRLPKIMVKDCDRLAWEAACREERSRARPAERRPSVSPADMAAAKRFGLL